MKLYSAQQAHAAWCELWPRLKASLIAGKQFELTITEVTKSREQEKHYHALIADVARSAQHLGAKWDAESWKRLLLDKFARDTGRTPGRIMPNLDGTGIVDVGLQSRRFSVSDASEFIEWLQAWCVENGVETRSIN